MTKVARTMRAFFVRDLSLAVSYPLNFLSGIVMSFVPVLVLYLPAQLIGKLPSTEQYGGYLAYAVIGSGLMNFFIASYGIYASAIQSERAVGTLEALLMTPTRIPYIILASTLYPFVWSTATTTIYIGGGALVYGIPLSGSVLLAFSIVLLTTLIFASLGVVSASYVMVWKRGDPLRPLIGSVFFLLGDVFYPTNMLPGWLQGIARLLPVTHAAGPLRDVLLKGATLAQVADHVLILVLYAAVLFPSSLWLFARAVRRATRDGTLLAY